MPGGSNSQARIASWLRVETQSFPPWKLCHHSWTVKFSAPLCRKRLESVNERGLHMHVWDWVLLGVLLALIFKLSRGSRKKDRFWSSQFRYRYSVATATLISSGNREVLGENSPVNFLLSESFIFLNAESKVCICVKIFPRLKPPFWKMAWNSIFWIYLSRFFRKVPIPFTFWIAFIQWNFLCFYWDNFVMYLTEIYWL